MSTCLLRLTTASREYLSIVTKSWVVENKVRLAVIVVMIGCMAGCNPKDALFQKLDVEKSGIVFENKLSPTDDFNILDYLYFYNGGGVAIGDINGDDLPDLFFSGNQVENRLYLNKGNLKFEDITQQAGVGGQSTWNTGAVMADVNGDGLLDIYVCAVVGLKNLTGHNELFINNGDNTFTERSAEFGLDHDSYSSSAVFLDYDLDGDLDMYLLNHAVHTSGSFGHADLRQKRTYESGDKLLRNDGGKFVDVSEQAGIYGGINGYGLGITVSDFNLDGYPDIYVGNDFHEDDYYYVNNGDGTFSEKLRDSFIYTSRFSMGNDAADINHDGYPDLISLDMLPEDEEVLKRSEGDENINTLKLRTSQYGYYYQFVRNMMQVNQGNGKFVETGLLSNVAATDWSWSALFSDFDQDGNQDLFVANGIPRRPNDLDYIKYVSSKKVINTIGATKLVDEKALSLMPSGIVENYIYQGSGNYSFVDKSGEWLPAEKKCSTAAAMADLDNDGDLDIVVNNVNDKPSIYINQVNERSSHLKIRLKYKAANAYGIGSKVYAFKDGRLQMKELYAVRGFQSSSEPIVHFGFGAAGAIDSLVVVWPNGGAQRLQGLNTNQTLTVIYDSTALIDFTFPKLPHTKLFEQVDVAAIGLSYKHQEDDYTDFDRLKLLPYQQSDKGPATAIGDLNNDGKADIFFGGSKRIPSQIFYQLETGFSKVHVAEIEKDSIKEEIEAVIDDFDGDGRQDLFVGTGGADFYGKSSPLLDGYYHLTLSGFSFTEIPDYFENASCIKVFDYDQDGDKDVFVGNESVSNDFGNTPRSYLLRNDAGKFTPVQTELFENLGMVTDAVWSDYNTDGKIDLIIVGEWMNPVFLKNDGDRFLKETVVDHLEGLWQSIIEYDVDHDGDVDFLLGNWGLNSKYKANQQSPMRMYYGDFDGDGKSETIVAIEKSGEYFPVESMDMLASQMVSLHKKYTSYKDFAGKTIDEIFDQKRLKNARLYEATTLASGYLRNTDGHFDFIPFSDDLQLAPILTMLKDDFDVDGKEDVLLGGNYFGVQPFYGRYGSFGGALVKGHDEILLGDDVGLSFLNKSIRHLNTFELGGQKFLLVTVNNDSAQVYKMKKK